MFGKKKDSKDSKKLQTILGDGTEFKGEMIVKGTIRIDGSLEGDVKADWVIVGETGRIVGNVVSKGTVVGGTVEGNVDADEILELKHTSRVFGEIRTGKLAVAEGAVFEGQTRMKRGKGLDEADDGNVRRMPSPVVSS